MLCVAGDFNAYIGVVEPGDVESIGRFGWGTRNRKGRELVEMLRRNGLAVEGMIFQKKERHKIPAGAAAQDRARSTGGAATAARECEGLQSLGGRASTTQCKPVVFEVRMKK